MKRNAFTLAELLMVVVIIGILATIMYPNFVGFRIRARLREAQNTVELIRAAEKYFFFKNNNYRTFAENAYVGDDSIENDLNITIPKGGDAFCEYAVETSGSDSVIRVWTPSNQSDTVLYTYTLPDGPGTPNAAHGYHIYITW